MLRDQGRARGDKVLGPADRRFLRPLAWQRLRGRQYLGCEPAGLAEYRIHQAHRQVRKTAAFNQIAKAGDVLNHMLQI